MLMAPGSFLSLRLRPLLRFPLVLLLSVSLFDLTANELERRLDWDISGRQRCELCGALREAKVWGPLTFASDPYAHGEAPPCANHDWEWTGCLSTRCGIICLW